MPNKGKNLDTLFVSGWSDDEEGIEPQRNPTKLTARYVLEAAENGYLQNMEVLLSRDPSLVNVKDKEGYTPLHRACYGNHVEMVKYLLQHGANIAAKTELEWEPLHSSVHWNNIECARILIAEGANVNAPSQGGQTPLHIAATHGADYAMVQLLMMHPYIEPNLKNSSNETAFDIALRSSKYRNVMEMAVDILDSKNIEDVSNSNDDVTDSKNIEAVSNS